MLLTLNNQVSDNCTSTLHSPHRVKRMSDQLISVSNNQRRSFFFSVRQNKSTLMKWPFLYYCFKQVISTYVFCGTHTHTHTLQEFRLRPRPHDNAMATLRVFFFSLRIWKMLRPHPGKWKRNGEENVVMRTPPKCGAVDRRCHRATTEQGYKNSATRRAQTQKKESTVWT